MAAIRLTLTSADLRRSAGVAARRRSIRVAFMARRLVSVAISAADRRSRSSARRSRSSNDPPRLAVARGLVPAAAASSTSARSSSGPFIVAAIAMLVAAPLGLGCGHLPVRVREPAHAAAAQADRRAARRHPERRARLLRAHGHQPGLRPEALARAPATVHTWPPPGSAWASSRSRSSRRSPRTRCTRCRTRCARPPTGSGRRRKTTSLRVVFPAAVSGIVAALILGFSRAIGETMVVAIAAGGSGGSTFTTESAGLRARR